MRRLAQISRFAVAAPIAVLFACGGDSPTDQGAIPDTQVDSLIAAGIQSMENAMFTALNIDPFEVASLDAFSFAESNGLFLQALDGAPTNTTAALGVAVTTIFLLEDDPQLRTAAEQWEAWVEDGPDPVGPFGTLFALPTPLGWDRATLPLDFSGADIERVSQAGLGAAELARSANAPALAPPPSIATHQDLLANVVAPALEDALDALLVITDPAFAFSVTERMQGEDALNADPLELDYTEVLALQAGLEVALASIAVATAYSLEPNPTSISGFVTAMTPGSGFLELNSGGAGALAGALTRLRSAADIVLAGLDNLEAETDDQSDDIIKYDPTGSGDGVSAADVTEARDVITDVQAALTGPTTVIIDEGGLDEFAFDLDAQEFFLDPITDFKAILPAYEVGTAMEGAEQVVLFRWTDLNLADWTFPDPTFSGLLPGMTNQELIDDLGAADFFSEFSLTEGSYRLITVDGVDCYDDVLNGSGLGCQVGSDYYQDGSISLYDDAFANLYGSTVSFFEFGTHSTVDNGGGNYTVTIDLQTVTWAADLTDQPGYASEDSFFRRRGGSVLVLDYLGSIWIFEDQSY